MENVLDYHGNKMEGSAAVPIAIVWLVLTKFTCIASILFYLEACTRLYEANKTYTQETSPASGSFPRILRRLSAFQIKILILLQLMERRGRWMVRLSKLLIQIHSQRIKLLVVKCKGP